jgi:hypothetical protein
MSNQFLNSESIFEVIGNYPVVDQFDVLYTNLQSGSYVDNYITGSMLIATRSPTGVGFTFSSGERGLAFSKLGVSPTSRPEQFHHTPIRSYNLQPWRERAGTVKNIKIFSNSERYYDSLMPDLSQLAKQYGVDIQYFGPNNPRAVLELGTQGVAQPNPGRGFLDTFIFEPKFSNVRRLKSLAKGFVPTALGSGVNTEIQTVNNFYVYSYDYWKCENGVGANKFLVGQSTADGGIYPSAFSTDVGKVIYGYGDWNPRIIRPLNTYNSESYRYWPFFRSGSVALGDHEATACSPVIRGWRYGVFDASPHYTSCIFRRDRFGQFRDMLEQRTYPVSYLDYDNAPTRYFGDFETSPVPNIVVDKKLNETIEYPVTVTFVKQQTVTIGTPPDEVELLVYSEQRDRNQTWSSNLSAYATSSLPYFDLENTSLGRNRGEIPSSVINPEVVYTTI